MKISIITINYNDVRGLKKTFDSVFAQAYMNIEYIVIDGGSNDGSKELIEQNSTKITYWISEKDSGVYNAMNKGIDKATGDYLLFLNSGDYLFDNEVLQLVANTKSTAGIIYGNVLLEDKGKLRLQTYPEQIDYAFLYAYVICHQVMFIKKELFTKYGNYREDLDIIADWEHYTKLIVSHNVTTQYIQETISVYNMEGMSSDSKVTELIRTEREKINKELFSQPMQEVFKKYNELQKKYDGLIKSRSVVYALKISKAFKRIFR